MEARSPCECWLNFTLNGKTNYDLSCESAAHVFGRINFEKRWTGMPLKIFAAFEAAVALRALDGCSRKGISL
jgi:hypothetical protein